MRTFKNFLNEESGAAAAEYVLIIAVIGGLIAAGGAIFGQNLSTALGSLGTFMTTTAAAI